jgi:hypothetical protein
MKELLLFLETNLSLLSTYIGERVAFFFFSCFVKLMHQKIKRFLSKNHLNPIV